MTDTTKQTQAASDDDLIRRGDVLAIQMLGVTVTRIERAIRAIPKHDPLSDPRVVALVEELGESRSYALALEAELRTRTDRLERECALTQAQVDRMLVNSTQMHVKIDSLSSAAQALGAMPEGYCFCSKDRIGDDSKIHEPECRDLRAAIRAIGGEA